MLHQLVNHLKRARDRIVRSRDIQVKVFDDTYGWRTMTETIQDVDFDQLLREIDEFAATFKGK